MGEEGDGEGWEDGTGRWSRETAPFLEEFWQEALHPSPHPRLLPHPLQTNRKTGALSGAAPIRAPVAPLPHPLHRGIRGSPAPPISHPSTLSPVFSPPRICPPLLFSFSLLSIGVLICPPPSSARGPLPLWDFQEVRRVRTILLLLGHAVLLRKGLGEEGPYVPLRFEREG